MVSRYRSKTTRVVVLCNIVIKRVFINLTSDIGGGGGVVTLSRPCMGIHRAQVLALYFFKSTRRTTYERSLTVH